MTAGPVRPAPPPAGSMAWHAWLYTPRDRRDVVAALLALADEWQSLANPRTDHGVAHLKLQWWRDELARFSRGEARHPLTQALWQARPDAGAALPALEDALSARRFELANATYETESELDAYFTLSAGPYRALGILLAPDADPAQAEAAARAAGRAIRQVESIRDLHQDATAGRIHLPLAWLAEEGVAHQELRAAELGAGARRCLERLADRARVDWREARSALDRLESDALRGVRVSGELHAALLARIASDGFAVGRRRFSLGAAASLWTAWRAARQH